MSIRITPVHLNWMISPSVSGIVARVTENESAIIDVDAAVLPAKDPLTAALENVRMRVVFESGQWLRSSPSFGDTEVFPPNTFEIVGQMAFRPDSYLGDFRKLWVTNGRCPDPGIYLAESSNWLEITGAQRFGCKHFVLCGHDMWLEVLALACTWSLLDEPISVALDTTKLET
jgi:hypothetical protein